MTANPVPEDPHRTVRAARPARPARADRDRLRAAEDLIYGDGLKAVRRQWWYAAYVAVLMALVDGFPVLQALARTGDPKALADLVSGPRAAAVATLTALVLVVLAYRLGRVRGPVVPVPAYLELVATSPLDRAEVLRRSWRGALSGVVFAADLVFGVVAAALAYAQVWPWWALPSALAVAVLLGRVVAGAWLWGQVRAWPTGDRSVATTLVPTRGLRALSLTGLDEHAVNSNSLGTALMTADLRTVRLQLAAPIRWGRRLRLRAGGPVLTVVRRDVLGLRRMPLSGLIAVTCGLAGGALIATAWSSPTVPLLAAVVGSVFSYAGASAAAEGARSQADNSFAHPLLGLAPRVEAAAHAVLPLLLSALSGGVGAALTRPNASAYPAVLACVLAATAAALTSAFKWIVANGPIFTQAQLGSVLWRFVAPAVCLVVGVGVAVYLGRSGELAGAGLVAGVVIAGLGSWAVARLDRLTAPSG